MAYRLSNQESMRKALETQDCASNRPPMKHWQRAPGGDTVGV